VVFAVGLVLLLREDWLNGRESGVGVEGTRSGPGIRGGGVVGTASLLDVDCPFVTVLRLPVVRLRLGDSHDILGSGTIIADP
jgi:hypothetical protein